MEKIIGPRVEARSGFLFSVNERKRVDYQRVEIGTVVLVYTVQ